MNFSYHCGTITVGRIGLSKRYFVFILFAEKKKFVPLVDKIEVFMVNNKALRVARYAIMLAVIFVAMMIDRAISMVGLPFSMAACAILITLSFCLLENDALSGVLAGLFFGLASFVKEFIFPSPTVGAAFAPQYWLLITIPPRVLMGLAAFWSYRLMLVLCKKLPAKRAQQVSICVAALVGCIVNTVGFLSAVQLCNVITGGVAKGLLAVIYGILLTNILPEYLIAAIGTPLVVAGVRKGLKLGIDGNNGKRARKQA